MDSSQHRRYAVPLSLGVRPSHSACIKSQLETSEMNKSNVLLQYHILKTAGTSFERVLINNFGQQHLSFDGPTASSRISQKGLIKVVDSNPTLASLSSHQISLPASVSDRFLALPVVFVRHPILRICSVFLHEHRQAATRSQSPLQGFEACFDKLVADHPNQLQIGNL